MKDTITSLAEDCFDFSGFSVNSYGSENTEEYVVTVYHSRRDKGSEIQYFNTKLQENLDDVDVEISYNPDNSQIHIVRDS